MTKVPRLVVNRVITIHSDSPAKLDRWTSELLDIIDSYGGSNPYPRFFTEDALPDGESWYGYSLTTKITKAAIEEFDKDIAEWKRSNNLIP